MCGESASDGCECVHVLSLICSLWAADDLEKAIADPQVLEILRSSAPDWAPVVLAQIMSAGKWEDGDDDDGQAEEGDGEPRTTSEQ